MRMRVWSLALLSGLRSWHCCELSCRSQTQLRSGLVGLWWQLAAAALVRSPGLGTSIYHEYTHKKEKKKLVKDLNRRCTKEDIQMFNKHMKQGSKSLITRKMQIKSVMKCRLDSRITIIKWMEITTSSLTKMWNWKVYTLLMGI